MVRSLLDIQNSLVLLACCDAELELAGAQAELNCLRVASLPQTPIEFPYKSSFPAFKRKKFSVSQPGSSRGVGCKRSGEAEGTLCFSLI